MIRRVGIVGVFVTAVAFTPLTATFSQSQFEAWFPGWDRYGPPHVVLDDRTGLVMAMRAPGLAAEPNAPIDRLLVVTWLGGCSDQEIDLTLAAEGAGYRVSKREVSNGCPFLVGLSRNVVLQLRQPVDAASVQFEALDGSVR